jgi:hypothetical protein
LTLPAPAELLSGYHQTRQLPEATIKSVLAFLPSSILYGCSLAFFFGLATV